MKFLLIGLFQNFRHNLICTVWMLNFNLKKLIPKLFELHVSQLFFIQIDRRNFFFSLGPACKSKKGLGSIEMQEERKCPITFNLATSLPQLNSLGLALFATRKEQMIFIRQTDVFMEKDKKNDVFALNSLFTYRRQSYKRIFNIINTNLFDLTIYVLVSS